MPHRIRSKSAVIVGGGGVPGPPGTGNVVWGPDFGEASGNDGITHTVGVDQLPMDALGLENIQTVGVNFDLDALALESTQGVGVDLEQDVAYENVVGVGVDKSFDALALESTQGIGTLHTFDALALENTQGAGVHQSGTVIGAPFWQSVGTVALATVLPATQIVCPMAAGVQDGDELVGVCFTDSPTGTLPVVPAGWIQQGTDVIQGNLRSRMFTKVASGEGANLTIDLGGLNLRAGAEIHRIIGQHAVSPVNAAVSGNDSVTDPVVPAVDTTVANCLVLTLVGHVHAVAQTHAPPANHVERTEFEDANVTRLSLSSYTRVFSAIGSTGTATVDCNELAASSAVYHRIAIAPGTLVLGPGYVPATVIDASGNGHAGIITGVPFFSASPWSGFGNALNVDGIDSNDLSQGVQSIDAISTSGVTALCLEAKVRRTRQDVTEIIAAWRQDTSPSTSQIVAQLFWFAADNKLGAQLWDHTGTLLCTVWSDAMVPNSEHDVALTWDGTTARLYLDGTRQASTAAVASIGSARSIKVGVGRLAGWRSDEATSPFALAGAIDEVRLSKVARYIGASYVPASAPFASDADTLLLWHMDNTGP